MKNSELSYLISDAKKRLTNFLRGIKRVKKHINPTTFQQSSKQAQLYMNELNNLQTDDAYEYLRTHQSLIGALITSTDWQSPSFAHSQHSQAGRETGKIYATINDYKRDQHWDAYRYEQAFRKEYIDCLIKFPIHVDATSSGMAAFTTILMFLSGEKKLKGKILCGNSVYFENKWLLTKSFPDQLIFENESDSNNFIEMIDSHRPSAIFLDSLTNAPDIIVPNIKAITEHLLKTKTETYLVIDNTGLSVYLQPFPLIIWKRSQLRLILFESLLKYHQFGMDRTNGGIIISYGKGTEKIFDYRDHSGTIISDVAASSLPTPNRKFLIKRLAYHTKNAKFLAGVLQTWIDAHPNSPFEGISYPGIGSYFTVKFKKMHVTIPNFKRFVKLSLAIAKHHHINLVSGSSFGFNSTRVYLTAMRSKPNTPFIRIAIGTEPIEIIQSFCSVFIEVFSHFK